MTIQTRPDGLIFAESAKNGEVESFPNLLRGWGVTLDQTEGIPPMEWFNALFQRQDKAIKYLLQQGITQWHKDEEYPKDAIVKHEGKTWQATQDNKSKVPQSDSVDWKMFVDGYSKAEANATFVDKTAIKQEVGPSETSIMSQKAISNLLAPLLDKPKDVTEQRVSGSSYVNNTSSFIVVIASFGKNVASSLAPAFYVDNHRVIAEYNSSNAFSNTVTIIVPPNSSYKYEKNQGFASLILEYTNERD